MLSLLSGSYWIYFKVSESPICMKLRLSTAPHISNVMIIWNKKTPYLLCADIDGYTTFFTKGSLDFTLNSGNTESVWYIRYTGLIVPWSPDTLSNTSFIGAYTNKNENNLQRARQYLQLGYISGWHIHLTT